MFNTNNFCFFEGRITQNQKYSQFQGQNGPVDKVFFSISVPRALTSQQRQDQNAKKNDFVNFEMIGPQVKTLQQYFPAGTPIKVVARYKEYESIDNATGQKKYGHVFEVEQIGFVVSPSQNQGNGNNGNNNNSYQQNNYQQQPQQNQQVNQNFMKQPQPNNNQQGNFQMFGENEYPF
jgi:single-stranded DNA-binding protein